MKCPFCHMHLHKPACEGVAYADLCLALADDAGIDEEGGSEEFLVFENVLQAVAKEAGLVPVCQYDDDQLDACFLPVRPACQPCPETSDTARVHPDVCRLQT